MKARKAGLKQVEAPRKAAIAHEEEPINLVEESQEEPITDEGNAAQEEEDQTTQPVAPAKKKGFFARAGSMVKKAAVKSAAVVKNQFTGKCVPGHIPESEEERIACQSNVRRATGAINKYAMPSKPTDPNETAEERAERIASENPLQQATRQMREQAMTAAGQVAVAGTAALTARTQQAANKVTTAMTKQIARIAPKPKAEAIIPVPDVVEPEEMFSEEAAQEETMASEASEDMTSEALQDEDLYAQQSEEYMLPDSQWEDADYGTDVGSVDQGEEYQVMDNSDPYASDVTYQQDEFGNPIESSNFEEQPEEISTY